MSNSCLSAALTAWIGNVKVSEHVEAVGLHLQLGGHPCRKLTDIFLGRPKGGI